MGLVNHLCFGDTNPKMLESLHHIDPSKLAASEEVRHLVVHLLNVIESQRAQISSLEAQVLELSNEVRRLKGGNAIPDFSSQDKERNGDHSSGGREGGRRKKRGKKSGKKSKIEIDNKIYSSLDRSTLPGDAQFKGYESVIQQNLSLVRNNTLYLREVYYSASTGQNYRADWPEAYVGYFGADLQSLIHVLYHVGDVTQPKLKVLLSASGIEISTGSINNILLRAQDWAPAEQRAILAAGISLSPYTHTDSTQSKERGQRRVCHIIGGRYFEVFYTLLSKSRLSLLAALQGNPAEGITLRYDLHTQALLKAAQISRTDRLKLAALLEMGQELSLGAFEQLILSQAPEIALKQNIGQALALSYYHQQTAFPVVEWLLSDDAPENKKVARTQQALCWIHDARHYNKLQPKIAHFQGLLEQFQTEYWQFYQQLLDYKAAPQLAQQILKEQLQQEFERIFSQQIDFLQLDQLIQGSHKNKNKLLAVLQNPALPLHNNDAELGARRILRKRDISLHTWSQTGTQVRDAMMSIVQTAKKLGISTMEYIADRVSNKYQIKSLAKSIEVQYLNLQNP